MDAWVLIVGIWLVLVVFVFAVTVVIDRIAEWWARTW